jgi:predicted metal-dependent RNase
MSRWRVVLKKKPSNITLEEFQTRKEAEEEVAWRTQLERHLKITSKNLYEIQKVI